MTKAKIMASVGLSSGHSHVGGTAFEQLLYRCFVQMSPIKKAFAGCGAISSVPKYDTTLSMCRKTRLLANKTLFRILPCPIMP